MKIRLNGLQPYIELPTIESGLKGDVIELLIKKGSKQGFALLKDCDGKFVNFKKCEHSYHSYIIFPNE